jgi:NADH-ubiquinone oxidoreductase chain 6
MKNFIKKIKNIRFTRKHEVQNTHTVQYHDKLPLPMFIFHYFLVIFFHFLGALILVYIIGMGLMYLGFVGELSSRAIFFVWQILGSYVLPTAILILSIFVIISSNPVYSLICLILVFFSSALFLLSINVNFLAMIYLIIYIGAIAILFLFVIMMFNLRELNQQATKINDFSFLSISFSLYFFVLWKFYALLLDYVVTYIEYEKYFYNFVQNNTYSIQYFLTYQYMDTLLFGTLFYTYYSYLFLVAALILLTSMLGSIILALSTTEKTMETKSLASFAFFFP